MEVTCHRLLTLIRDAFQQPSKPPKLETNRIEEGGEEGVGKYWGTKSTKLFYAHVHIYHNEPYFYLSNNRRQLSTVEQAAGRSRGKVRGLRLIKLCACTNTA